MSDDELGALIAALCEAIEHGGHLPGQQLFVDQLLDAVGRSHPEVGVVLGAALIGQREAVAQSWGRALLSRGTASQVAPIDVATYFQKPPEVDVLLLTVKVVEYEAAQRAFGIQPGSFARRLGRGDEMFIAERDGRTFGIAMIGFAGNVESAMRMAELLSSVRFKSAILVGMAAGRRSEVDLGDVVIAESVIAYEYMTLKPDEVIYSPVVHTVPRKRIRQARTMHQVDPHWSARLRSEIMSCSDFAGVPADSERQLDENWECEVATGAVLAGARLVENGSIPFLSQQLSDRVKAVEMEGAGFAAMCTEFDVDWLVVRGIADFGEPERSKGWQFPAAYAAAAFVRDGLGNGRLNLT